MIDRQQLIQTLQTLLQPERFKDYCHNGLQVEGRAGIGHLVSGVTASEAFIQAAIDQKADAVLVHHGLFWKGFDGQVSGWMRKRLGLLIAHNINLLAYHLPLDAHPELGNNAQLARQLGIANPQPTATEPLLWQGDWGQGTAADFAAQLFCKGMLSLAWQAACNMAGNG